MQCVRLWRATQTQQASQVQRAHSALVQLSPALPASSQPIPTKTDSEKLKPRDSTGDLADHLLLRWWWKVSQFSTPRWQQIKKHCTKEKQRTFSAIRQMCVITAITRAACVQALQVNRVICELLPVAIHISVRWEHKIILEEQNYPQMMTSCRSSRSCTALPLRVSIQEFLSSYFAPCLMHTHDGLTVMWEELFSLAQSPDLLLWHPTCSRVSLVLFSFGSPSPPCSLLHCIQLREGKRVEEEEKGLVLAPMPPSQSKESKDCVLSSCCNMCCGVDAAEVPGKQEKQQ